MKKISALFLSLALLMTLLAACGTTAAPPEETVPLRIGGLTGPTSIGMVKLMQDDEAGKTGNDYVFTLAGSADVLTPQLVKGELDFAAIPANLAAVLYNNTDGAIEVVAINTLGVLYLVEKGGETVNSIADLKGKTIYATGKGSPPEYTLRYLLSENGLDPDKDVTIEWKSEPAEIVSLLAGEEAGIAMLPQPYVTVAQSKVSDLRVALDLTKEWDALGLDSTLITGVTVVRRASADAHPKAMETFLSEYQASITYVNENVTEAAKLVEQFNIIKAAVAEPAIPACNLTYLAGKEMKTALGGYLEVLYAQNPASVGGALPPDDFYFGA